MSTDENENNLKPKKTGLRAKIASSRSAFVHYLKDSRAVHGLRQRLPDKLMRRAAALLGGKRADGKIHEEFLGETKIHVPADDCWNMYRGSMDKYEPEIGGLIDRFVKNGNTLFIDCGANIGLWSSYAADKIGGEHVVAVEPNEDIRKILEMNGREHGFRIIPKAILDVAGQDVIIDVPGGGGRLHTASSVRLDSEKKSTDKIMHTTSVTLDDIIREHAKDSDNIVIKLDVEGVETQAMKGAEAAIAANRNVLVMYEDHGEDRESKITQFIFDKKLHVYYVDEKMNARQIAATDELTAIKKNINQGYNFVATIPGTEFDREMQRMCGHEVEAPVHEKAGSGDKDKILENMRKEFAGLEGLELLQAVYKKFGERMVVESSFGRDSAITLSMIAKIDKDIPVVFADTGMHFVDTLKYADTLKDHFGLTNVRHIKPLTEDVLRDDPYNKLHKQNLNACCEVRKIIPMKRTLGGGEFDIVVTGRSRKQTQLRESMQLLDLNHEDGLFRVNPLANWTREQRLEALEGLPQHTLDPSYTSIGCRPVECTKPVEPGQDDRAGRWADDEKTLCGLEGNPNRPKPDGRVGGDNAPTSHTR